MGTTARLVRSIGASIDAVVVPYFADRRAGPGVGALDRFDVDLRVAVRGTPAFRGEASDPPIVIPPTAGRRPTIVIVGLGPRESVGAAQIRHAAQRAADLVRGHRRVVVTLAQVGDDRRAAVRAAAEGFLLGCYSPSTRSTRASHESAPESVDLLVDPGDERRAHLTTALKRGQVTADQANWARELVDTPAGHLTPARLAERIRTAARGSGVRCQVWSASTIEERGFGALLAVGRGSRQRPQVVELTYGRSAGRGLGLVGKGVTFDSGGLNLKRDASEIAWMKSDMAGAIACAGAVIGAGRLGLATPVRAILPLVENMPGGDAVRPGDVVTHPNGATTEITDTDCEGRLILADALAFLAATPVSGIIDVATLTDAAGFGPALWAGAASDDALMAETLAAADEAGEPGWRMPLVADYADLLRSPVADQVNAAGGTPDTSVLAATYLRAFAGEVPWVHIDNGSTAYLERPWAAWPVGATGSPLRALVRLLENRATRSAV